MDVSTREVPCRTSAETERETPRQVRLSTSDRTPERTHRVGERVDKTLERVNRELQGGHRRGGARRARRPGSRRRAARNQTAQCTFSREQSRSSRTVSHQRTRAGENTTDPRNQSRIISEKGALCCNSGESKFMSCRTHNIKMLVWIQYRRRPRRPSSSCTLSSDRRETVLSECVTMDRQEWIQREMVGEYYRHRGNRRESGAGYKYWTQ